MARFTVTNTTALTGQGSSGASFGDTFTRIEGVYSGCP
jgi:hypothetical protein